MENSEAQPDLEPDKVSETSEAPSPAAEPEPTTEARLQALERATREPPKRDSTGKRIRDWTGFGLGLIGAILGTLGFLKSQQTASITQRIEVEQYLAEAWDLMGGKPGTIDITSFAPQSQLELARRLIDKALFVEPKSPEAHRYKGVYFIGRGKLDKAIDKFQTAIELDPDYAKAHSNLGNALGRQNRHKEAVAAYRQAIKFDPDDAVTHNNLGNVLRRQGDLDAASEE